VLCTSYYISLMWRKCMSLFHTATDVPDLSDSDDEEEPVQCQDNESHFMSKMKWLMMYNLWHCVLVLAKL